MANTFLRFFTLKTYFHIEGYGVIIIFYESSFSPLILTQIYAQTLLYP